MEKERRVRTEKLIGVAGCEKLAASTVAVCGLGGVGSYVVEALARAGVGRLILIDFDTVSVSNINRQIEALTETVGLAKAMVLKERIASINPESCVETRLEKLTAENIGDVVLSQSIDFLVDAIDDVSAKISLLLQAKSFGLPVVSVMGTGNKLYPELLEIADISKTEVCPLARKVRKVLKAQGIVRGIPVVYSKEIPVHKQTVAGEAKEADGVVGSISFVPGAAGLIAAGFVVRSLLGQGLA